MTISIEIIYMQKRPMNYKIMIPNILLLSVALSVRYWPFYNNKTSIWIGYRKTSNDWDRWVWANSENPDKSAPKGAICSSFTQCPNLLYVLLYWKSKLLDWFGQLQNLFQVSNFCKTLKHLSPFTMCHRQPHIH